MSLASTYNAELADVGQLDVLENNVLDHAVCCSRDGLDADSVLAVFNRGIIEKDVLDGCITWLG